MKRWTLRIVVLLILGAIVNVAVAWGCVLVSWPTSAMVKKKEIEVQTVRAYYDQHALPGWPSQPNHASEVRGIGFAIIEVGFHEDFVRNPDAYAVGELRFGIPLRSMKFVSVLEMPRLGPGTLSAVQALPVGRTNLPTGIDWVGFIGNTIIYAVLLCVSYLYGVLVRSRFRIKRGRCPKCAYDLRTPGSHSEVEHTFRGCPECGCEISYA